MNWLSFIGGAAKFIFGGVIDSINQKRTIEARENAAEHNLKLAVLNAKITKAQKDGEWEVEAVKNHPRFLWRLRHGRGVGRCP